MQRVFAVSLNAKQNIVVYFPLLEKYPFHKCALALGLQQSCPFSKKTDLRILNHRAILREVNQPLFERTM